MCSGNVGEPSPDHHVRSSTPKQGDTFKRGPPRQEPNSYDRGDCPGRAETVHSIPERRIPNWMVTAWLIAFYLFVLLVLTIVTATPVYGFYSSAGGQTVEFSIGGSTPNQPQAGDSHCEDSRCDAAGQKHATDDDAPKGNHAAHHAHASQGHRRTPVEPSCARSPEHAVQGRFCGHTATDHRPSCP